jgi:Mo-dependent nitrogenase C-terminus
MSNLIQIGLGNNTVGWVRDWLEAIEIHNPKVARFLCKFIPDSCPFEQHIELFHRTVVHIPPLCKLNPFYEQLVGLRFRSLSYLADECGEDVTPYCH